jgi:hypothetical protein
MHVLQRRHSPGIVSKWACGKAKTDGMVDVNDREPGSEGQTIDNDHPLAISPARISQTHSHSHNTQSTYRELLLLGNSANALVDC